MSESTPPVASFDRFEPLKKSFRYKTDPGAFENDAPPTLEAVFAPPFDAESDSIPEPPTTSALCWRELLDSYFQSDGKTRNRAQFFIENNGRDSVSIALPPNAAFSSVRAVWLDDERVVGAYNADSRTIRVSIPPSKRYVRVSLEYCVDGPKLAGGRRLVPSRAICDVPVLSSVWNARTPPQYLTAQQSALDWIDDRVRNSVFRYLANPSFFGTSREAVVESSRRFLARLGDADAVARAIAASQKNARAAEDEPNKTRTSASRETPTWGDVFGSPEIVNYLFSPEVPSPERRSTNQAVDALADQGVETNPNENDETNKEALATPFGSLVPLDPPFELFFDRFALSSVGLEPSTPLSASNLATPTERALQIFEKAGVVLVFFDENSAIITTRNELERLEDAPLEQVNGSSIFRIRNASKARELRTKTLASVSTLQSVRGV